MADSLPTPADSPAPSAPTASTSTSTTTTTTASPDDHLARGIRFLALSKYSDACDALAQAVEALAEKHGELAPESVDALVLYGKALLGNAIAQSAVLGGGAPSAPLPDPSRSSTPAAAGASSSSTPAAGPSNAAFHFGGDAEDDEDDEEEGEGEDDEADAAPGADREDDLESAFQVLDLARSIVEKEVDDLEKSLKEEEGTEDKETRRRERKEKLADVHRLLGDVATESEQFDGAVEEYSSALSILSRVLPPYDRALSELHMLIALALDFVPNATGRAVSHAEKAKGVLLLKLEQLENKDEAQRTEKEKREIDDIKGLMGDVDMKIEDLKTIPVAPAPSAADRALEELLRGAVGASAGSSSGTVNDLTSLVKKKKKAPVAAPSPAAAAEAKGEESVKAEEEEGEGKGKRKAEDVQEHGEKKVKLDEETKAEA
ncbi:hypothetical protein JCM1840_003667 [Sporobolomyces johnsonii]